MSHCCDNDHEVAVVRRAAQQVRSDAREEGLGELARWEDVKHVSRLERWMGGREGGRKIFVKFSKKTNKPH